MAIDYQQTDDAGTAGAIAACSGATVGNANLNRVASVGGTPGSSLLNTLGGTEFDTGLSRALLFFEITPAAGVVWAAGDWTVRLNISSQANNVTWTETHICRLNSSNVSQATIGSLTGQTTGINTTGVKTHVVAGSSQSPSAGDKVLIVFVFASNQNNRFFVPVFDQIITSPFTVAAVGHPATRRLGLFTFGKRPLGVEGVLIH